MMECKCSYMFNDVAMTWMAIDDDAKRDILCRSFIDSSLYSFVRLDKIVKWGCIDSRRRKLLFNNLIAVGKVWRISGSRYSADDIENEWVTFYQM